MHDSKHEANDVEQSVPEQRLTRALDLLATAFETDAEPVRSAAGRQAMFTLETVVSEVSE